MKLKLTAREHRVYDLTLKELIRYCGGPDKIKAHTYDAEAARRFVSKHQDKLVMELLYKGYDEIKEITMTKIADYCETLFELETK